MTKSRGPGLGPAMVTQSSTCEPSHPTCLSAPSRPSPAATLICGQAWELAEVDTPATPETWRKMKLGMLKAWTLQLQHPLLLHGESSRLQTWTKAPAPDPSNEGTDKDVRSMGGRGCSVVGTSIFFRTEESAVFPNKAANHGVPEGRLDSASVT